MRKFENLNAILEKWISNGKKVLVTVGKVSFIAILITVGFVGGNVWNAYKEKMKSQRMQSVRQASETSVALNERGEMLIISRTSGKYDIYDDTVGLLIFNLYASKMHYEKINPNKAETRIDEVNEKKVTH